MGEFMARYVSHGGRVTRKTMWIGMIPLVLIAIVLEILLALLFGGNAGITFTFSIGELTANGGGHATAGDGWRQLFILAVLAYPVSALLFKRSHDLNVSGILVAVYLVLAAFSYILLILGLAPSWFAGGVNIVMALLGLYLFVTLGFFPGTKGSNLYGAEPE